MIRRLGVLVLAAFVVGCSSSHSSTVVATITPDQGTLSPRAGPTWVTFPIPGVVKMVVGHDGNVWFFTNNETYGNNDEYGFITPTGMVQTRAFPDGSQNGILITPNPDGNVYILSNSGGHCHLYQIHPDLTAEDLIAPFNCEQQPNAMVTGYDRRLWIVLDGSDAITRVTTNGVISQLAMPGSVAGWIIRGNSSGRAMFVQGYNGRTGNVYRIGSDRSITSSAPLLTNALSVAPTTANDGYVWFETGTETHPQLVRMDDNLDFTLIPFTRNTAPPMAFLPHFGVLLMPCSAKPDSNAIFRFDMNRLSRLTRWTSPSSSIVSAIIGPDGKLWETDESNVYVGTLN